MILYTAGYEGQQLHGFLDRLQQCGVHLLADVREAPISRKPGFAKSALSSALAGAGIDYVHLRALGCPKPIRDAYKADGDWGVYTKRFIAHLDGQQPTLQQLADLASVRATAVMCYEADFTRCHRTYVAQAVAKKIAGAWVCHITQDDVISETSSLRA